MACRTPETIIEVEETVPRGRVMRSRPTPRPSSPSPEGTVSVSMERGLGVHGARSRCPWSEVLVPAGRGLGFHKERSRCPLADPTFPRKQGLRICPEPCRPIGNGINLRLPCATLWARKPRLRPRPLRMPFEANRSSSEIHRLAAFCGSLCGGGPQRCAFYF